MRGRSRTGIRRRQRRWIRPHRGSCGAERVSIGFDAPAPAAGYPAAAMRAIRSTSSAGRRSSSSSTCRRPRWGRARCSSGSRRAESTSPTRSPQGRLRAAASFRSFRGRRWPGWSRPRPGAASRASAWWRFGPGGYAEYAAVPAPDLPHPRGRRGRRRARAARPGPDRVAPAADLGPARGGGVGGGARGRGRGGVAGGSARQALRRGASDRHGLHRGEARAGQELGADAAVDPAPTISLAPCARPTAAGAWTSCSRWPAGACSTRAAAIAPFGRLVAYGMASREPGGSTATSWGQGGGRLLALALPATRRMTPAAGGAF